MVRLVGLFVNKFLHFFYYFFCGLLYLIFFYLNFVIIFLNSLFKTHFSKLEVNQMTVRKFMIVTCFGFYFFCVFLAFRYYVQEERCRKFSDSLLKSTNIIVNMESDISKDENDVLDVEEKAIETIVRSSSGNQQYTYRYDDYFSLNVNQYVYLNEDIVGWLKVEGTSINYAVVQSSDNAFYLNHDLNKRDSITGWVFMDYRNDVDFLDRNTIVYGHSMANGTIFGTLFRVLNRGWYTRERNHYIKFNTRNQRMVWEVFSVYSFEPVVDYLQTVFEDDDDYNEFLMKMKARSIYDFGVDVDVTDRVLTLQTCDSSGNNRIILQAKLIKCESY